MKTQNNDFRSCYQKTMVSMTNVKGFEFTVENKIHIGLTILCQCYENKKVTIENLNCYFSELSNFFTDEKLDLSFGYVLKKIHPSQHMITEFIWGGKKMTAKTLRGIFKDLSTYCYSKNDKINGNKFEFIMTDYDTMHNHNIKFDLQNAA